MKRIRYGVALTAVGAALMLSGCGGSGSKVESAPGGSAQSDASANEAGRSAPVPAGQAPESPVTAKPGDVQIAPDQRSIVYVAQLTVKAKDVNAAAELAKQIVVGSGGNLASEESNAFDSGEGSSTLTFKIPPAR